MKRRVSGCPASVQGDSAVSRRSVLAGAVTLMSFPLLAGRAMLATGATGESGEAAAASFDLAPGYLCITQDNQVHIVCPAAEMGQGVSTSLPALIAEEMEAEWSRVQVTLAPAGEVYINPAKNLQATGRSMSVRGYFESLRKVGAEAKGRLLQAASESWGVSVDECAARNNSVTHPQTGRSATFAELAERAAAYESVTPPPLKKPADYRILGKSIERKDLLEKVTGRAVFGVDIDEPGMLIAAVSMAPTLGGELTSFDKAAALKVRGVKHVVPVAQGEYAGVAVVADSFWHASKGLEALQPVYSNGSFENLSSADLTKVMRESLASDGAISGLDRGDCNNALQASRQRVSAVYGVPYLAHAAMEPMSCFAHVTDEACRLIAPTQGPLRVRDAAAAFLGLDVSQVTVERTYLGGAFGRRWQVDFAMQAVELSRACKAPVKLIWSREEDMRHDFYRPQALAAFEAGLDDAGNLTALELRTACASIIEWGRPGRLKGRADPMALSGLTDTPYHIPNLSISWVPVESPVPVGVWRSVGHSQNGFFMESFIDEAAVAADADPLAFRRALLANEPRMLRVLDTVAALGNWRKERLPEGKGQGTAIVEAYGSIFAYVIDVTVREQQVTVDHVACVIDCGYAVNPDGVEAQVESNVVFALTAAFYGKISLAEGAVEQSNFHDYRMVSLAQTPPLSIEILNSEGPMGGVGEPGTPPFAPALLNAIFAAKGERLRTLPLSELGYTLA